MVITIKKGCQALSHNSKEGLIKLHNHYYISIMTYHNFRKDVAGINIKVPVIGGALHNYINFDNAASTPPLKCVWETLKEFKDYYSSVHRGTGYKSVVSTKAYDLAHEKALQFVDADPEHFTCIMVRNTTEGINRLSRRLGLTKNDIVLSSLMEHHSNDLPWRMRARIDYIEVDNNGQIDLEDLHSKLLKYGRQVKLVAISGASNVTGLMPPIGDAARIAHDHGAQFMVDAAQLAPHREIRMGKPGREDSIDFLVFSGHKMYAPFGAGVLIGPKSLFKQGDPDLVGGGAVNYVTLSQVQWAHLPDKEEAGSPNVPGAVALASAMDYLRFVGFRKIAAHEKELTKYALEKFAQLDGITLYGPTKWIPGQDRVGVISLNVDGVYHAVTAAILSFEGAVAVRNGCFCAHPYIMRLLKISDKASHKYRDQINAGVRSEVPGLVRVSFGIYNTKAEIDTFFKVLKLIINRTYKGEYLIDKHTGQVRARGFKFPEKQRFLRHENHKGTSRRPYR
jgi:selenocysteine lyase/cysteine desulfurase